MKSRIILIAALIFAVATTILFGNYLNKLDSKAKSDKSLVQVVVLKQDIKRNQRITPDMLELKSYSQNSVLPDAIKDMKELEGSFALIDMKAGEQLFKERFIFQTNEKEYLTRKITAGKRAVSIEVTYVEPVSTMIEPEDYVDVIFSRKAQEGYSPTLTLLENIRVLAVGERISKSRDTTAVADAKNIVQSSGGQAKYASVTLELTPAQAELITNAELNGELKFTLRSELEKH